MRKLILAILIGGLSITAHAQKIPCNAKTKAGQPCKNYAIKGTTTCYIHAAGAPTCGSLTQKGQPCKVRVKVAGTHCWRHKKS